MNLTLLAVTLLSLVAASAACVVPALASLESASCQEQRHVALGLDLAYRHAQKIRLLLNHFETAATAGAGLTVASKCWKALPHSGTQNCDLIWLANFRLRTMAAATMGLMSCCPGCNRQARQLARHLSLRVIALNASIANDLPAPQSTSSQSVQRETSRQIACVESAASIENSGCELWSRRRRDRRLGWLVAELRAAASELEADFGKLKQPVAELLAAANNDQRDCRRQTTTTAEDYSDSITEETSTWRSVDPDYATALYAA